MDDDKLKRKLMECAFLAGKKRQSPQTGFVHYFYENDIEEEHHTIPLFENFCFALALLRTRLSDHVIEAKLLLEKLINFEVLGNFPIYLHDYPQCKKRWQGISLVPVIADILEEYQGVLGEKLSSSLTGIKKRLLDEGLKMHQERSLPKAAEAKLLAALGKFNEINWNPSTPSEWGEYLIAAKLSSDEDLQKALNLAKDNWHPILHAFIGEQRGQQQDRGEPAITLFDLWMGQLFRSFSKRALQDYPLHLQGALIPTLAPIAIETDASSYIRLDDDHLTLFWGNSEVCHSLCSKEVKGGKICTKKIEDGVEMLFSFPDSLPVEEDERMEVSFFANVHEDLEILINGKKSTTFKIEDEVVLKSQGKSITLKFSQEGEGAFFGHLLRSNRPSQTNAKREKRFEAYDWLIALRTLRREKSASIKLNCVIEQVVLESGCQ